MTNKELQEIITEQIEILTLGVEDIVEILKTRNK